MHQHTGQILPQEEIEKLKKSEQKNFIPIPENEINRVTGMNRAERRAWAKNQKRIQRGLK